MSIFRSFLWALVVFNLIANSPLTTSAWAQLDAKNTHSSTPILISAPEKTIEDDSAAQKRNALEWLERIHSASHKQGYVGTFVVMPFRGNMHSARIWHFCDGMQQLERVETLTGAPRSTFRHNERVITYFPNRRIARIEKRKSLSLGAFPYLQHMQTHATTSQLSALTEHYQVQFLGRNRVAGFDADVIWLKPKDRLRFGYRVWSEKKSGLLIKLQTLDTNNQVLEQIAFSELQLNAEINADKMQELMENTSGYEVEQLNFTQTTPEKEGWSLKAPVAGFTSVDCHRRNIKMHHLPSAQGMENVLQWTFSDGLATVSLFIEPWQAKRPRQETEMSLGATQTLSKAWGNQWWLTVVGEVPIETLKIFADYLERLP